VFFETYAPTVDIDAPVPPQKEPTEADGEQYLQLLKDAMRVHMYAPQANASNGLEVLRALEQRNHIAASHPDIGSLRGYSNMPQPSNSQR